MESPLITGKLEQTPLDMVTERLLFTLPLNAEQIQWLNTPIWAGEKVHINYWTLTHFFFGMVSGILYYQTRWKIFSLPAYFIQHALFELWELWAGGYLDGRHPLTVMEVNDILIDTLFGLLGFAVVWYGCLKYSSSSS